MELTILIIIFIVVISFVLYWFEKQEESVIKDEGFTNNGYDSIDGECNYSQPDYFKPVPNNPFGNLLLTDIGNTEKLQAPPAFSDKFIGPITDAYKQMIKNNNKELNPLKIDEMFNNYYDNFIQEDSMRQWYSTASTQFVNSQASFGQFLFGNMPSRKGYTSADAIERTKFMGVQVPFATENTDIPLLIS